MDLTCPECCYVALRNVGKYKWECEECGITFNLAKMRNLLDALVGRQFQEDFIDVLLNGAKPTAFPKLGERAWKWTGKYGVLYTIDTGNGWHILMKGQKVTSKSYRSNAKS